MLILDCATNHLLTYPLASPSHQGGDNHMKILVTGVNGQLGHDVINELAARGHEGIGSRPSLLTKRRIW